MLFVKCWLGSGFGRLPESFFKFLARLKEISWTPFRAGSTRRDNFIRRGMVLLP